MICLGCDPGKSGAIVALSDDISFVKLCETEHDINEYVAFQSLEIDIRAVIEQVNAMPKQGVSSTFKFGMSYGFVRGLVTAHSIPFKTIRPAQWQQIMRCRSKGDKNVTKAAAQRLFPGFKVSHATADALLLAELCRTKWDEI